MRLHDGPGRSRGRGRHHRSPGALDLVVPGKKRSPWQKLRADHGACVFTLSDEFASSPNLNCANLPCVGVYRKALESRVR